MSNTDAMWAIGDDALAAVPMGGQVTGDRKRQLAKIASDHGVSAKTLMMHRLVAHRWPSDERRHDVAWTVHRVLASAPNRFAIIQRRKNWTIPLAQVAVNKKPA